MGAIIPGLLTVIVVIISFAVVLGIFLFFGWLLTLFLPFSLFEGVLLSMIASLYRDHLYHLAFRCILVRKMRTIFEADAVPGLVLEHVCGADHGRICSDTLLRTRCMRTCPIHLIGWRS